jgi:hypothetical protein
MTKSKSVFARFLVVVAVVALSLSAVAQMQNGQITGTVLDQQGAAISGATVKVSNPATNLTVTATSSDTGLFIVKELPAGNYKMTVEKQGFKTASQSSFTVNAGVIHRVDFKLTVGERSDIIEVIGTASLVNTEDSKLATTVSSSQIANLPLNGRNVYDLIQTAPGAVNVAGTDFENGHSTVVNGLRENFNGFLVNGVSNKGLSGGVVNVPIQDTVQEFQQLTLNMSAQYGNSAGSISNLVTKSGTNSFHGSAWWFIRNDMFDANQFFLNQSGAPKPALRFNQFGGTFGGPIIKNKLFFFASYQGDHFRQTSPAQPAFFEGPEFRAAVAAAFPNSVANLLYSTFRPSNQGTPLFTLNQYLLSSNVSGVSGFTAGCPKPITPACVIANYEDPANTNATIAANFATLFGFINPNAPFLYASSASFQQQSQTFGNLFQGKEATGRLDYNWNDSNRMFLQFNWFHSTDGFGPCNTSCARGFSNPGQNYLPSGQFNYVHTFSPRVVNEARVGYTQNNNQIGSNHPGVPQISFGDITAGFGSYSGYPQFFREHIYTYSDMLSISHGSHSFKIGGDIRRNIENSEFSVARPSYYFFDPLFFAVDAPAEQNAGVNPGIISGNPAQLQSNFRHFRNWEYGLYFQDDWKVSRRLTLNLGIRWDLFVRHSEENNLATTFILGPGTSIIDNISTGAGQIHDANIPAGAPGCTTPTQIAQAQLAGICGPGGFAAAATLGAGRHKDFGPRVGFAWDIWGDGKTSLRGGFGISYEGTLYNPLSNSRWNLPFYSFNTADTPWNSGVSNIIYGPPGCPNCSSTPTFTGPPTNAGQGVGAQATGNLSGWDATNPNLAVLTGIVFPSGISDPYVYNYFLSFQHELLPKLVLEINYVGTTAHKLFRAEDVNRIPGGKLNTGTCVQDNFGRTVCSQESATNGTGRLNPNYGRLRVWENAVNSNYNSMQVSVRKQMSHGFQFNANYTWSHSIDGGSTWHSGATTANGAAAGEGFTLDQTMPSLDRGNSLFDIRQRAVANYIWEMPFFKGKGGFTEAVLGGWTLNGIWSFQSGAHWSPFCSSRSSNSLNGGVGKGCDWNKDAIANDRPNAIADNINATHDMWANGFGVTFGGPTSGDFFTRPCIGNTVCTGNLGRNTFVGPGDWVADMSLLKNFRVTERVNLQFRSEFFNIFNHTNFVLATAGGGANNRVTASNFGQAGGTLNSRNIQFGLKLTF